MKYEGKLYTKEKFIGDICSDSYRGLIMKASRKCNGYFNTYDKIVFQRFNDMVVDTLKICRFNKKHPSGTIIRGQWR